MQPAGPRLDSGSCIHRLSFSGQFPCLLKGERHRFVLWIPGANGCDMPGLSRLWKALISLTITDSNPPIHLDMRRLFLPGLTLLRSAPASAGGFGSSANPAQSPMLDDPLPQLPQPDEGQTCWPGRPSPTIRASATLVCFCLFAQNVPSLWNALPHLCSLEIPSFLKKIDKIHILFHISYNSCCKCVCFGGLLV